MEFKEKKIYYFSVKAVYYKQLKGGVDFVDFIPKSPSGKILRRLLKSSDNESNKKKSDNKNIILSKL
jgi:acyl-coenzyme A synthetase/AMP-(fatty) acid ligase